MDTPALLHVALAKLKIVTIQTTLKRSILRRRMTFKTERSETYSIDKGVCALGDRAAEGHKFNFIMIQQLGDIQSCFNVFLPRTWGHTSRSSNLSQ